ncbi:hypothetical protein SCALM49S_05469 [Streptomyces californicus]
MGLPFGRTREGHYRELPNRADVNFRRHTSDREVAGDGAE